MTPGAPPPAAGGKQSASRGLSGYLRRASAGSRLAAAGIPLTAAGLAVAFRGPKQAHWRSLALTHGTLGLAAALLDQTARHRRPTRDDLKVAVRTGTAMFTVGVLADGLARRLAPRVASDAEQLRTLTVTRAPARMSAHLLLAIAPGEELFWRGLVQDRLARRYGTARGAALTTALYTAAHLPAGNAAVASAASSLGATLSVLRARGASLERLALIHACWVLPTLLNEQLRPRPQPQGTLRQHQPGVSGPDLVTSTAGGPQRQDLTRQEEPRMTSTPRSGRNVSRWSRLVQRANNAVHTGLYERTNGRFGTRMLGNKVGILTTRRSPGAAPYSVPLFTFADGPDTLIVASYRGSAQNPRWYRNLLAHPDAYLQVDNRTQAVRATVLEGAEREKAWQQAVEVFSGYAEYQRRTTREIPVVRLSPVPGRS